MGGANWVGVAAKVAVGGPGVKEGNSVRTLDVTVGCERLVTVAISVAVGPVFEGDFQAKAMKPTQ